MSYKRVNLNIDDELLYQLDEYAKKLHICRSSALSVLLSQIFEKDGATSIKKVNKNIEKITKK